MCLTNGVNSSFGHCFLLHFDLFGSFGSCFGYVWFYFGIFWLIFNIMIYSRSAFFDWIVLSTAKTLLFWFRLCAWIIIFDLFGPVWIMLSIYGLTHLGLVSAPFVCISACFCFGIFCLHFCVCFLVSNKVSGSFVSWCKTSRPLSLLFWQYIHIHLWCVSAAWRMVVC